MAGIQSSIGLITGVPIEETVNKLLEISARPRALLESRVAGLKQQQVAVAGLTASVIAIQLAARNLGKAAVFNEVDVASARPELLAAAKNGDPAPGTYRFVPVRQAQTHQLLSTGFSSTDQALGEGTVRLRFGGFVDQAQELSALNEGAGVQRGKIRITDRSGASQVVDLGQAQTIDDVLQAINSAEDINVAAAAVGDSIRLTDLSGQTTSNLKVQEVGSGSTAADLGLAGIDVAASTATGGDIVQLHGGTLLRQLNDGNGIRYRDGVDELTVQFRDGSSALTIDLDFDNTDATVGDLLEALNAADPTRLAARISADGDRIELEDLTSGGGQFVVASANGSDAAADLGIAGSTASSTLSGRRLLGGLRTTLVSTLNGGQGWESLGQLSLTDRSGATATVDLSGAETLDDVLTAINAAGVGITAAINHSRNGIELRDTTGATTQNLVIADADATQTATALGLVHDAAATTVDSGSLARQVVSHQTELTSLQQGAGIGTGSFTITDTLGAVKAVNLSVLDPKTVGDVIDAINALGLGLEARINDAGDGIALVDTAGGSGAIQVTDSGSGQAAKKLGIAGTSELVDIDGTPTQVLAGSTTISVEIDADDTLTDLVAKINELGANVAANIFTDGSGATPHRLAITSQISGKAGELLIDTRDTNFQLNEVVAAQDALLLIGSGGAGGGILATSSSNTFHSVVDGVSLTLNGSSTEAVEVRVTSSSKSLETNAKLFVEKYNATVDQLKVLTSFNPDTNTTGTLFGSGEVLRVERALGDLMSGAFFGAGDIRAMEELGFGLRDDGKLDLDSTKLKEVFAARPDDVEEFFTKAEFGFGAKLEAAIDRLAGEGNSVLLNRNQVLQEKIENQTERIESLNVKLEREREMLLKRFYQLELNIARMQDSLSAITNLQPIPFL